MRSENGPHQYTYKAGIAIEVTHRSKRRLYGLAGLAPLREAIRQPYRPQPGRGRGRPRRDDGEALAGNVVLSPLPPLTPIARRALDYSDLTQWMTHMDATIRHVRRTLDTLSARVNTISPAAEQATDL
jgi:hypothetical protein